MQRTCRRHRTCMWKKVKEFQTKRNVTFKKMPQTIKLSTKIKSWRHRERTTSRSLWASWNRKTKRATKCHKHWFHSWVAPSAPSCCVSGARPAATYLSELPEASRYSLGWNWTMLTAAVWDLNSVMVFPWARSHSWWRQEDRAEVIEQEESRAHLLQPIRMSDFITGCCRFDAFTAFTE